MKRIQKASAEERAILILNMCAHKMLVFLKLHLTRLASQLVTMEFNWPETITSALGLYLIMFH
jgi:hypothetical protein